MLFKEWSNSSLRNGRRKRGAPGLLLEQGDGTDGRRYVRHGGELGKNIQQWDGYGDLIQTLARWLNRKNPPQGYSVRADTAGDRLRIRLYYSEENIPRLAERMPEISLELSGKESSRTQNGIWEHLQPGIFQCSFPLPHGVMARGAVRIGGSVIPFGPVSQQVDPEWAMPPESGNAFLDLVNRTGGRERMDLPSIFREPRPGTSLQLRPILLWSACVLLVLDALFTRTGLLPRGQPRQGVRAPGLQEKTINLSENFLQG